MPFSRKCVHMKVKVNRKSAWVWDVGGGGRDEVCRAQIICFERCEVFMDTTTSAPCFIWFGPKVFACV